MLGDQLIPLNPDQLRLALAGRLAGDPRQRDDRGVTRPQVADVDRLFVVTAAAAGLAHARADSPALPGQRGLAFAFAVAARDRTQRYRVGDSRSHGVDNLLLAVHRAGNSSRGTSQADHAGVEGRPRLVRVPLAATQALGGVVEAEPAHVVAQAQLAGDRADALLARRDVVASPDSLSAGHANRPPCRWLVSEH